MIKVLISIIYLANWMINELIKEGALWRHRHVGGCQAPLSPSLPPPLVLDSDVYLDYQWPEWISLSTPQTATWPEGRREVEEGVVRGWSWVRGWLGYWGMAVAAAGPMVVMVAGGKGGWWHCRSGGGRQLVQRVSVEGWRWLRAAIWVSLVGGKGI
jgi:hypothetical protein